MAALGSTRALSAFIHLYQPSPLCHASFLVTLRICISWFLQDFVQHGPSAERFERIWVHDYHLVSLKNKQLCWHGKDVSEILTNYTLPSCNDISLFVHIWLTV